jgi:hypothetical protein
VKLIGISENNTSFKLRYETTFKQGWKQILCLMQVLVDDFQNSARVQYFETAGSVLEKIPSITDNLLHKTEQLKEERGGVVVEGISKTMELVIRATAYNQTNIVDVQLPKTQSLVEQITKNNHILDKYMNSVELNGCSLYAQKCAIEKFAAALEKQEDEEAMKTFIDYCDKIGAVPFPKK